MTADPGRRARLRFAVVAIGAAIIAYGLLDVLSGPRCSGRSTRRTR